MNNMNKILNLPEISEKQIELKNQKNIQSLQIKIQGIQGHLCKIKEIARHDDQPFYLSFRNMPSCENLDLNVFDIETLLIQYFDIKTKEIELLEDELSKYEIIKNKL